MTRYGAIDFTSKWNDQVFIRTRPCVVCGKQHEFMVSQKGYEAWQTDTKIQDAFPELSVADREILISGTCDECFNQMFPPEGDE